MFALCVQRLMFNASKVLPRFPEGTIGEFRVAVRGISIMYGFMMSKWITYVWVAAKFSLSLRRLIKIK